jgi:hypothetical protein
MNIQLRIKKNRVNASVSTVMFLRKNLFSKKRRKEKFISFSDMVI